MNLSEEKLPEELYEVLSDLLNTKSNIAILNSIRGELGVLKYLIDNGNGVTAGELGKKLRVVPGRMADILKSLEQKGLIIREKNPDDRRVVRVMITEQGVRVSKEKREEIRKEYQGLFEILSVDEVRELIRLLKIVLSYYPDK